MPTHTYMILTGALVAIPLSQYVQCGHVESSVPCGDDVPAVQAGAPPTAKLEELGKQVFFDKISVPNRMACATCHAPAAGWTLKNSGVNAHQVAVTGADPHTAGGIKPPTSSYAKFIPPFNECKGRFPTERCGGAFWDGRAEGKAIGDEIFHVKAGKFTSDQLAAAYEQFRGPLAEQALAPFLNPVEQNVSDEKQVCQHVAASKYAPLYEAAWGEPIDCSDKVHNGNFKAYQVSYERIAVSIAAYEFSDEVNPFNSKRDTALQRELKGIDEDATPGKFPLVGLTEQENHGHDLFYNQVEGKRANCSVCHSDNPPVFGPPPAGAPLPDDGTEPHQTYTDKSYHNIGIPANPEIAGFPELAKGLAGHTGVGLNSVPGPGQPDHLGMFKTPTVRNVDLRPGNGFTKAYGHNGYFKSLESIVHFYNTANVNGETAKAFGVTRCKEKFVTEKQALEQNCWPEAETPRTSAVGFLIGDAGMNKDDEAALVAYLKTLTDTTVVQPPKPYK